MKCYNVNIHEHIYNAYIDYNTKLSPMDYIDCDTIEEVIEQIKDDHYNNISDYGTGDVHIEGSFVNLYLPEGFEDEWIMLKEGENEDTDNT